MSESLKGFYAVAVAPNQIRVQWDWITQADFEEVEIVWWCLGQRIVRGPGRVRYSSQLLIPAKLGETYVVAAQAHFTASPITGVVGHCSTEWAWGVVKMPQEDKPQYVDLGQVTVIDTPRGPAILLDKLRDVL